MTYGNYENFDCNNIKKLISIKFYQYVDTLKVLNDGRILVRNRGNSYSRIIVYNLKKCQLNKDNLDSYEITEEEIILNEDYTSDIIELDDNNFILKFSDKIKIIKIKEEKIEVIKTFDVEHYIFLFI